MTRMEELRRAVDAALVSAALVDGDPEAVTASALDSPVHVARVTYAVRDLDRVTRFYEHVLGFRVIDSQPGMRRLGAGDRVLLELIGEPDALPDDTRQAGLYHTAFLMPSRADLGRWLRHAAAAGQPLDGAADHLVSEALYLHDPEGNGVEIYADRPRSAWGWGDRQVGMANDPVDFAGLLAADGGRPWAGAPEGMHIGHVHLRVGDADAAALFYTEALGMDVTRAFPAARFLSWGGYHHHVAANVWHSAGAGQRDERMAGLRRIELSGRSADLRDPWGIAIRSA